MQETRIQVSCRPRSKTQGLDSINNTYIYQASSHTCGNQGDKMCQNTLDGAKPVATHTFKILILSLLFLNNAQHEIM